LGRVREEAVEEDDVARLRRHGAQGNPGHLLERDRAPFLADEPVEARPADGYLQATVLDGGLVDADHRRGEEGRIARPPGLLVLMQLEAGTARLLEVDLLLEQHGRAAEQLLDR